jgi:dihydroorotate dehydrogenase (fumarate)
MPAIDLTTRYLGLDLRNPVVASPSPLTARLDGVQALAEAGVGAIVLCSVLEEQVFADACRRLDGSAQGASGLGRVSATTPAPGHPVPALDDALALLRAARSAVDVPLIASLNGGAAGGWPAFAHALQEAGASAIELNVFDIPADDHASAREIEDRHVELLATVKSVVTIPVAVKLAPWLTAPGELAARLLDAGADGLVLFNRFMQPDIDVERLAVVSRPELSSPWEARLPMTWIALLRGRTDRSLAATTGVAGPLDVARYLLAGADVVMSASALLRHGPAYADTLVSGLRDWVAAGGHRSVGDVRGLLRRELGDDARAKRGAYLDFLAAGSREFGA